METGAFWKSLTASPTHCVRALRRYGTVFLIAASAFLLRLAALLLLLLTALLSRGRWQPLFFSFPTARGARAHEEE